MDENQKTATMELLDFIAKWISNHILKKDQKYSSLLKENNVK